MAAKLGFECKLFKNTGTHGTPTWSEDTNVKDVTLSGEKSEADFSTRASRFKLVRGALIAQGLDFKKNYDPADTHMTALIAAFYAETVIEFFVADGAAATVGTAGLRASMSVMKCNIPQPLEGPAEAEITIKPTISSNAPTWYTVA